MQNERQGKPISKAGANLKLGADHLARRAPLGGKVNDDLGVLLEELLQLGKIREEVHHVC